MLGITILLRRLFTRRPSGKELEFDLWFLDNGIKAWSMSLAEKDITPKRRAKIIRGQFNKSATDLEVWDPSSYRSWLLRQDRSRFDILYLDQIDIPSAPPTPDPRGFQARHINLEFTCQGRSCTPHTSPLPSVTASRRPVLNDTTIASERRA